MAVLYRECFRGGKTAMHVVDSKTFPTNFCSAPRCFLGVETRRLPASLAHLPTRMESLCSG